MKEPELSFVPPGTSESSPSDRTPQRRPPPIIGSHAPLREPDVPRQGPASKINPDDKKMQKAFQDRAPWYRSLAFWLSGLLAVSVIMLGYLALEFRDSVPSSWWPWIGALSATLLLAFATFRKMVSPAVAAAIVLLALIGVGGWYVWQRGLEDPQATTLAAQVPDSALVAVPSSEPACRPEGGELLCLANVSGNVTLSGGNIIAVEPASFTLCRRASALPTTPVTCESPKEVSIQRAP